MMASTSSSCNSSNLSTSRSSTITSSTPTRALQQSLVTNSIGIRSNIISRLTKSKSASANTSLDIQSISNSSNNPQQDNPRLRISQTTLHQQQQHQRGPSNSSNIHKPNFEKHISPTPSQTTSTTKRDSAKRSTTESLSHATSHRTTNNKPPATITSESESDNETHSICSTTVTATSSSGGGNSKKSAFFKAKRKEKLRIRFDIQDSRGQEPNDPDPREYSCASWKDVSSPGLIIGRHRSFQVPRSSAFPPRRTHPNIPNKTVIPVLLSSPSFCGPNPHHQFHTDPHSKFKDPSITISSSTGRRGFYKLKPSHKPNHNPPDHIINSSVDSGISLGNPPSSSSYSNNFLSPEQTLVTKKPKRSLKKFLTKSRSFVLSSSSRDRDQNPHPPQPSPHLNSFSRAEFVAKYHSNNHLEKSLYNNKTSRIPSAFSSISLPRPAHNSFRVVPRSAQELICTLPTTTTSNNINSSSSCCNTNPSNISPCCTSPCQFPPAASVPVIVNPHTCCPAHGTTPYSPCQECKLLNVCNTLNLCRSCGGTVDNTDNNDDEQSKQSLQKSSSWISSHRSSSTMPQPLKKAKSTSNSYFYGKYSKLPVDPLDQSFTSPRPCNNHGDFLSLNLSLNRLYSHHKEGYESSFIRAEEPTDTDTLPVPSTDKDKSTIKKGFLLRGNKNKKSSSQEMALNRMNELVHHEQEPVESCGSTSTRHNNNGTIDNGNHSPEYQSSYYDYCRIPRPKLKFVVPTHSYGVSVSPNPNNNNISPTFGIPGGITSIALKQARKKQGSMQDLRGFSEVSLSSDGNDDIAYGSGSGSGGGGSSSSRFQSEIRHHSSDDTLSEFEREQEQIIMRSKHDERSNYSSQVDRIHSCEENSLALATSSVDQFPTDYTALYTCDKGIVSKGGSRRLLSFKKSYLPSLLSPKYASKKESGEHLEFLKSLPLFRKLSNGFLHKLTDHISEASYQCGEYILRQGSRGDGFFILISGLAKVTFLSNNHNGDEIYLRTLHPGDVFGEKSLQGDKINMMNVVAHDEFVSCLIISEEGFDQLMGKSGEFRQRFCEKVPRRLIDKEFERIELEDLRLISTLGIGGFGRVELVTLAADTNRSFALKQMKKCQIVATRQVEHIKSEKAILLETNCDFITKLYKTYKDSKYLYMLMECCLGGELWTILRDKGHFDDNTARFYVGCVLEALKYLHSRNIIYRDLKPENLLLDAKGYLKLVDFGFAKKLEGNKTWTFCGTPEYVAPEIILNKGHDITADYWSLGVLMYELLTGTPPFVGGDPMRTYKLILKGIDFINFPETVGKNAYNLIRKLCRENPQDRLGAQRGGLSDIKKHKWFDGLDWQGIRTKNMTPPITPCVRGPHDCSNFDEYPPDRSGTPPDDLTGWDWDF